MSFAKTDCVAAAAYAADEISYLPKAEPIHLSVKSLQMQRRSSNGITAIYNSARGPGRHLCAAALARLSAPQKYTSAINTAAPHMHVTPTWCWERDRF